MTKTYEDGRDIRCQCKVYQTCQYCRVAVPPQEAGETPANDMTDHQFMQKYSGDNAYGAAPPTSPRDTCDWWKSGVQCGLGYGHEGDCQFDAASLPVDGTETRDTPWRIELVSGRDEFQVFDARGVQITRDHAVELVKWERIVAAVNNYGSLWKKFDVLETQNTELRAELATLREGRKRDTLRVETAQGLYLDKVTEFERLTTALAQAERERDEAVNVLDGVLCGFVLPRPEGEDDTVQRVTKECHALEAVRVIRGLRADTTIADEVERVIASWPRKETKG